MIPRLVERRTRSDSRGSDWFAPGPGPDRSAKLLGHLGVRDWLVDVVLVDDETMIGLNRDFRKVPQVTDVLSFSYLLDSGPGRPHLVRGQGHAFTDLWLDVSVSAREDGEAQAVGEIVLATGFIADRCREKGWPLAEEIPLLLVHGVLHLLGWEHEDEAQTEAMRKVEEEILAASGLSHPLIKRS